ncbi:hypothetical protein [[Clostridium] fimetarium]|uniref:Uncharacterized protein n=1 Tax=[Clostridium] fimetarium TaxID=99656 RepID=A0A1I0QY40_9FIRM|nr:hypothetical protein [[Clostridium] fimetarium]SEW32751.1 hypothetical protein SAMN05421659_11018 [[Clostridium] fimetarium]
MSNKCKHKPENIFDETPVCKKCGKRLTHKIPFYSGFMIGTSALIASILHNYIFRDLITNITTIIIYFFISLVIIYVCEMSVLLIIGFKEDISFPIDEINAGIKDTFNSVLYYHGNDDTSSYLTSNKNIILKKDLQYELYYEPNSKSGLEAFVFSPKIYLVITNMQYPLSSEGTPQLYEYGIDITEWGLRSDFSYQGHWPQRETYSFSGNELIHLGSYRMRIEEIKKPVYETIDDEWKENAKSAIRLYMDMNDFYGDESHNLAPGNYHIYVQKFFKTDKDSIIIFENENGSIYTGYYYFVHDISTSHPADLNKVALNESSSEKSFEIYLEKVRLDPAVAMEYKVK